MMSVLKATSDLHVGALSRRSWPKTDIGFAEATRDDGIWRGAIQGLSIRPWGRVRCVWRLL